MLFWNTFATASMPAASNVTTAAARLSGSVEGVWSWLAWICKNREYRYSNLSIFLFAGFDRGTNRRVITALGSNAAIRANIS